MTSKVAIVNTRSGVSKAFLHALHLVGGIDDINTDRRKVTIKVGIYDPVNLNYPTVPVLMAVINSFKYAEKIMVAESDNHKGKALDRLQYWGEVFSDKVIPFSLSDDPNTHSAFVCGEKINFSHVLFKPNVLVSLHILRKGAAGSIFKNLLGVIPDTRKERFHDKLGAALVDIAEAIGWIDLSVIDGTYIYGSQWKEDRPLDRERRDLLIVGRDPVAVEVVGSILAGDDPISNHSIKEIKKRNLSEVDIDKIEVLGESVLS
jgi:uncharacterized protein (DUF362 family)